MADKNIKGAILNYDKFGSIVSITIDGKTFTGFPASSYGSFSQEAAFNKTPGSVPIQIEIDAGVDCSKLTTLPSYTAFHHLDGKRKSIASHS